VLTNNINLGNNWRPIEDFRGTLDGAGYSVTLGAHRRGNFITAGLFGDIQGGTVVIKNLAVQTGSRQQIHAQAHHTSNSRAYAGGLIGVVSGGTVTIENCSFNGNVQAQSLYNGLNPIRFGANLGEFIFGAALERVNPWAAFAFTLAGIARDLLMDGFLTDGSRAYAGGLIGFVGGNANVTITNSFAQGVVDSHAGLWTDLSVLVTAVRGYAYSGGLVGLRTDNAQLTIRNCYVINSVRASGTGGGNIIKFYDRGRAGSLVGVGSFSTTPGTNYRLDTQSIRGQGTNRTGVTPLSHASMQLQSSFSGWAFSDDAWAIDRNKNGGYPYPAEFANWLTPLPARPAHAFPDGQSSERGESLTITIAQDLSLFSGVTVNDRALTQNVHYTVTSGSTRITLLPAFLDTLEDGFHSLTVAFSDGTTVEEQFLIVVDEVPPVSNIYLDGVLIFSAERGGLLVDESFFDSIGDGTHRLRVEYVDGHVFEEVSGNGAAAAVDPPDSWAAERVNAAIAAGLVPDSIANAGWQRPTTRLAAAEAMILLIEAVKGVSMQEIATENGWDLSANHFADTSSPEVTFLRHAGVVGGVGNDMYDPNGTYTRVHTVVMLSTIAEVLFDVDVEGDNPFTDVPGWAERFIGYAVATFGITGVGGGLFDPDSPMQNQMTAMLSNLAYQAWR
jgi:hypothetical protein